MDSQNQETPYVEHEKSSINSNDISRGQLTSQEQISAIEMRRNVTSDNEIIFSTIINQINSGKQRTQQEWMKDLYNKISGRFNRMPRGWYKKIQEEFNKKHDTAYSLIDIKNMYTREKSKSNRQQVTQREGNHMEEHHLPPVTIKDVELFTRVRNCLRLNVEKIMNERENRKRTRKVYSQEINHDIINYMNMSIQMDKLDQKAKTMKTLNDLFYACQLTYEQITERPKKKTNWRQSIEEKIKRYEGQLEIINNYDRNKAPPKSLIKLCKSNSIHSNNQDELSKLKDQIEEKMAAYRKKIDISLKRIEYRRTNKRFEFNRKMFYRNLYEDQAKVAENINKQETYEFWREVWDSRPMRNSYTDLIEIMNPVTSTIDLSNEKIINILKNRLKYLPNWKSPGPEHVYNFFIKKMTSLHKRMEEVICEAVENPDVIEEEMYVGHTYLIPKVKEASNPADLRPITCLPNLYKLLSKIVATMLTDICVINEFISDNQMGARASCQGAKEQTLLNKCLNQEYGNSLFTSWIDIKKAYDSVQHEYIDSILNKLEVPQNIGKFINKMLKTQETNLICNKEDIGRVKIRTGLLQGDSISPLLFVLAMEPLSRKLNCNKKVQLKEIERNHLIFIDDIKLLAETEDELIELCQITKECLNKMGMTINLEKSASNISNSAVFGEELDDSKGYKYLGVLEDSRNMIKPENKRIIADRIETRTTKLCETKLNAVNIFKAINEYAISNLNYYIGVLPYEPHEFEHLDKMIRDVLNKYKITRKASNIDRLYLKRNNLGRGLINIVEKSELMLLKLNQYLENNNKIKEIIEFEKEEISHLGLIQEYLDEKYNLEGVTITDKLIQVKQLEKRMERIKSKILHGVLFTDDDKQIDRKSSSMWLMKGNITPQQEGMYCKLQDRNLYLGVSKKCPHCKQGSNNVEHLATNCGRLLKFDYTERHNEVVRCLHLLNTNKYGINRTKKLKNYKVQSVVENKWVKIKSDTEIITENRNISANKPDLMIHNKRANEITLIEVGITNKNILPTTETTKKRKYELLANELVCTYPGTKAIQIPVVLTWDGLVTYHFKRYMAQLDVSNKLQAYIQIAVLKRTAESILSDCKNKQNWMEEELLEAMENMENNSNVIENS